MSNPSDIIIPGAGAIPVDPNDPTKGMKIPVFNNQQLTGAIMELREVVGQIGMTQQATGPAIFSALNEIGELIECLAVVVLDTAGEGPDTEKDVLIEASDKLAEFVTARRELREQMNEQDEVDPALAGPEATPPTVPEQNDSEAAADDATWD